MKSFIVLLLIFITNSKFIPRKTIKHRRLDDVKPAPATTDKSAANPPPYNCKIKLLKAY